MRFALPDPVGWPPDVSAVAERKDWRRLAVLSTAREHGPALVVG